MCPPVEPPLARLPIATLRSPLAHGLRRRVLVDLERWLSVRRAWLRPRAAPLVVAFASLLAMLGAVKAVGAWSLGEPLALSVRARETDLPPAPPGAHRAAGFVVASPGPATIQLVVQPLAPGDRYLELTIGAPDPR